jgi:hypothetical protein
MLQKMTRMMEWREAVIPRCQRCCRWPTVSIPAAEYRATGGHTASHDARWHHFQAGPDRGNHAMHISRDRSFFVHGSSRVQMRVSCLNCVDYESITQQNVLSIRGAAATLQVGQAGTASLEVRINGVTLGDICLVARAGAVTSRSCCLLVSLPGNVALRRSMMQLGVRVGWPPELAPHSYALGTASRHRQYGGPKDPRA